MKKYILIILILSVTVFAALIPASASLTVDVKFTNTDLQGELAPIVSDDLKNELAKYSDMPEMARGFGNAGVYASQASNMRGYQMYDIFSISVGAMGSVQAPKSGTMTLDDISDDIDDGDVYAGAGAAPLVIQGGLNLGFLLDGLYMSFIFGKYHFKFDDDDQKIDHKENIIGFNVSYKLISDKSASGFLVWRGLSLQSGLIHYKYSTKFYHELDSIDGDAQITGPPQGFVDYVIDPSVDFNIETSGNIVPVELYTSARLLYILNIGVGGGFDYVINGKTDITLDSAGGVNVSSAESAYDGQTGTITVNGDTSGIKSDKMRWKLLANIGLTLGPVIIDFPVSYYVDNGYAIGITAGFIW